MRVDVIMPQMGESIAEGTITRWLKQVGDKVGRDEPLFEISTDKVDAEIPSPSEGTLVEIKNQEGETVPVNDVVAILETDAAAAANAEPPAAESAPAAEPAAPEPAQAAPARPSAPAAAKPARRETGTAFVSPVVRRIADEHGVDPAAVPGTGAGGRVTKKDILGFIEQGGTAAAGAPAAAAPAARAAQGFATGAPASPAAATTTQPDAPSFAGGATEARVPMSVMRRKIAEHMIDSRRTSAHVHSVFEVDMSRVVMLREQYKQVYTERHGTKLTFTPFFTRAVCDALRAWPVVNSSIDGNDVVYKRDLNIGMAVALDWGLIVPVIKNADELSMAGLAKRVGDLADRSRNKKLSPDEVQGGTFTITNPGIFGGLYGLPIINQPQVAILGIGGIEQRPVVINDAIAIRPMMYMAMSYDHRVVDGAVADQFLARVKAFLQNFDESLL